jgi:hypothetical protein
MAVPDYKLCMGPVGEVGANNRGRTRLFGETSLFGYASSVHLQVLPGALTELDPILFTDFRPRL